MNSTSAVMQSSYKVVFFLSIVIISFKYTSAQGSLSQSLCIRIDNTSLEEWSSIELTVKKVITDRVTLTCNNQPSLCPHSNNNNEIKFFTVADAIVLTSYPIALTNNTIEVAISVQYPNTSILIPISTLRIIGDDIHNILNIVLGKSILKTDPCIVTNTYSIDAYVIRDNIVIMSIGATTLEYWNNDLTLQYVFKETIVSTATPYCAQHSVQCAITNTSSTINFATTNLEIQNDYLKNDENNPYQLNIGFILRFPNQTLNHTSLPLVPRDGLVAIAIRAVTPLYNRTGRSVVGVSVVERLNLTGFTVSISLPILLFMTVIVLSLLGFWLIKKIEKAKDQQDNLPIPLDNDTDTVQLISYRQIAE